MSQYFLSKSFKSFELSLSTKTSINIYFFSIFWILKHEFNKFLTNQTLQHFHSLSNHLMILSELCPESGNGEFRKKGEIFFPVFSLRFIDTLHENVSERVVCFVATEEVLYMESTNWNILRFTMITSWMNNELEIKGIGCISWIILQLEVINHEHRNTNLIIFIPVLNTKY